MEVTSGRRSGVPLQLQMRRTASHNHFVQPTMSVVLKLKDLLK